jgi:hypothetical protein
MYFCWKSTSKQSVVFKVTHETWHPSLGVWVLFLQLVSQDNVQELLHHIISPYPDFSWLEFQFCCLRIRFVSPGVLCFIVLVSEVPRLLRWFSSTILVVPPYVFLCLYHLMSDSLYSSINFRTQHSFDVTFLSLRLSPFFIQLQINIQIRYTTDYFEFDGAPVTSRSHTLPSHSQTSRLLTSSLSLGVPVPHSTQCVWDM